MVSLGRASTPPVPSNPHAPTLGAITGLTDNVRQGSVLLVGGREIESLLREQFSVVYGIPGLCIELAALTQVSALVVEARALFSGPWTGADSHQSRALSEELFEAGRQVRARGGQVFLVSNAPVTGSLAERLKSTFTVDLSDIPEEDLEEGAPQTPLWNTLVSYTRSLNDGEGE